MSYFFTRLLCIICIFTQCLHAMDVDDIRSISPRQFKAIMYWQLSVQDTIKMINLRREDEKRICSIDDKILVHDNHSVAAQLFFEEKPTNVAIDLKKGVLCRNYCEIKTINKAIVGRCIDNKNFYFDGKKYSLEIRDHSHTDTPFEPSRDDFDCDLNEGIAIANMGEQQWCLFKTNEETDEDTDEDLIILEYLKPLPLFSGTLFKAVIVHGHVLFIMQDGRIIIVSPEMEEVKN